MLLMLLILHELHYLVQLEMVQREIMLRKKYKNSNK